MFERLTRRDVLQAATGGAAAAMLHGLAPRAWAQSQKSLKSPLNTILHCHTFGKAEDIAVFNKAMGVATNVTCWTSNIDTVTRLSTGGANTYDCFTMHMAFIKGLAARGVAAPIDWSRIPNTAKMMPMLKQLSTHYSDGKHWSMPWLVGYDSILYDKNVISNVDTYGLLFDPRFAGKVALRDDPQTSIVSMALYLGKPDPSRLTRDDLREISDFLISKKKNIRTLWNSFSELVSLMKSGEVVMANTAYIAARYQLRKAGMNVELAVPKEKLLLWTQDLVMTQSAVQRGMEDSVYALMNWAIGSYMGARVGIDTGYPSASLAALDELTPAQAADSGYGTLENIWRNGYAMTENPENLQEWTDAWSRFKAA